MKRASTSHAIKVGGLYHPSIRHWPEGAAWVYHGGRYDLCLRLTNPDSAEIQAVHAEPGAVGFFAHKTALLGLYRFADAIPWSDVLLEPHQWEVLPTGDQVPMAFVLVDAGTGIIRALRVVLLPVDFSKSLAEAAQTARAAFSPSSLVRDFAEAETAFTSDAMAARATHLAEHGRRQPGARA